MRSFRRSAVVVCAVFALGCQTPDRLLSPQSSNSGADTPITSGSGSYQVAVEDGFIAVDIDIVFRNPGSSPYYIANCNGHLVPELQKLKGGEWVTYWTPTVPECLSEPIFIGPGGSIERTIAVSAALPGNISHPQWGDKDVPGTYRVVLHNVVRNYDSDVPGFGDPLPLEQRVSNAFQLRL